MSMNICEYGFCMVVLKLSVMHLRLHMLRISLTLKNLFFSMIITVLNRYFRIGSLANLILKLGMMSSATQSYDLPKMTCIHWCIV